MVVRSRGEYEAGQIPGVQHVPFDKLDRRVDEVPDGPVLIVCRGVQPSYAWQMHREETETTFRYVRAAPRNSSMAAGPLWTGRLLGPWYQFFAEWSKPQAAGRAGNSVADSLKRILTQVETEAFPSPDAAVCTGGESRRLSPPRIRFC